MLNTATKRITLATFKAFVRKNRERLEVRVRSRFDGMTDGLDWKKGAEFEPVRDDVRNPEHTLGIGGAWLVLGGRDHFQPYETETHQGIAVANCCGYFEVATRKAVQS